MKRFAWDAAKNEWLKTHRRRSFEEVILALSEGGLLDRMAHPNQDKYPSQKMLVVNILGYAYLVPVVETADQVFLKTIIPSRKATKLYLRGGKEHG